MKPTETAKGFTLIELLVVVAIIGIISGVVLTALNSAREKGRDAQRSINVRQVQNALELYRIDLGSYPPSPDVVFTNAAFTAALTPLYIPVLPKDPIATTPYHYYNNNNGNFYAIKVNFETKAACYVCAGPTANCKAGNGYWGFPWCNL